MGKAVFSYRCAHRWPIRLGLPGLLVLLAGVGGAAPAFASPVSHDLAASSATASDVALLGGVLGGLTALLLALAVKLYWRAPRRQARSATATSDRRAAVVTARPPAPLHAAPAAVESARPPVPAATTAVPRHAASGPAVAASLPAVRRASLRSLKRWQYALIAGIAGLVLLTGTAVVVVQVQGPSSPQDTVRAYYEALADRDADQAKALLAPGYDGNGTSNASLLNSRVLADSGYHPPRDVRLERVDGGGPNSLTNARPPDAAVLASYTAAGKSYRQELRLIPHDGGELEHKWRIANPLLPLEVRSEAAVPLVAGVPVEANAGSVLAFPGAYTVTLPRQDILHADPVTLLAGPTDLVPLNATLREGADERIQRQVHRYVDACAGRTELRPEGCPYESIVDHLQARSVSRRVITYPSVRVEMGSWGELVVTTTEPGQMEYTPHTSAPAPRSVTAPFTVAGRARLTGDTIAFTHP